MITRRSWILMGVALLAAGCSSLVRVTNVEFDKSQDFSGYERFAFLPDLDAEIGDERIDNPAFHGAMQRSIVETLQEKGYRYTPGEAVDFKVGYHSAIRIRMSSTGRGGPVPYGYGSIASYGAESWSYSAIDDFEEGTLIFDIVDTEKNTSVWRGTAKTEVEEIPTIDGATKKIRKAVRKTFDSFPPE